MRNIFEINDLVDKKRLDIKSENKHLLVNDVFFSKHIIPDKKYGIHGTGEKLNQLRKSLYRGYTISLSNCGNIPRPKNNKLNKILKTLLNNNIIILISAFSYSGSNSPEYLIWKHVTTSNKMKTVNVFCHDKIEKNGLIAQIIGQIIDRFVNRAKEIMLNNVNEIKKILINIEQLAKQLNFYYSNIINRRRIKFQKKYVKNLSIIVCTEENYKIVYKQDIPLKWIYYQ
jgi:hypothetical protein